MLFLAGVSLGTFDVSFNGRVGLAFFEMRLGDVGENVGVGRIK